MDKRTLELEYKSLKEREKELKKICSGPFETEEEGEKYIKDNWNTFNEFKNVRIRIKEIEWELMTEEEKEAHLQYLKGLKEKFKDES